MNVQNDEIQAETCDVFVIGGGPGGSAAAILLAEAGLRVVIAEKDPHPRFHIGESLLPYSLPDFERLGVLDRVKEIGVHKNAAQFISEDGETTARFPFARALSGGWPHAYQVTRAEFDNLLFDRAREVGAVTLEGVEAKVLSCVDGAAVIDVLGADEGSRRFQAEFLIDASGRATIMAKAEGDKRPDPRNTSAAIFGHFAGVPRPEGDEAGDIHIHLTNPGWMWRIPLRDGVTSIGLVAPGDHIARRDGSIEDFFAAHCARHPSAQRMMANAQPLGRLRATGNFSYSSGKAAGDGHYRVGDAFGFIDPIFSTGVHLALSSAREAAESILRARGQSGAARRREYQRYEAKVKRRISYVSWFIYRIHDLTMRGMLLHPRDILGIERAVISLLAGDFSRSWDVRWRIGVFKALFRALSGLNKAFGANG